MPPKPNIILQTSLSPEECLQRLRESTDEQHRTFFTLSGYKGTQPVLSLIQGSTFRVQKRRNYRNDLAPNFYGTLTPRGAEGTRIEGHFGPPRWSQIMMRIWLGFAILVGIPIFIAAVRQLLWGRGFQGNPWVGLISPSVLIFFGAISPWLGDWLGRNEKPFILQFLETTLAARPE